MTDGAAITATAGGTGQGGNVKVYTDTLVLDNSKVIADAFMGKGGNVGINAALVLLKDSDITASSQLGVNGTVEINQLNSPDALFGISNTPTIFPTEIAIASPCSRRPSEFSLSGGSQLPLPPSDLQFAGDVSDEIEPNALLHRPDGSISLAYSPSLALNCQR